MKKTMLSIKIDPKHKQEAKKTAEALGIPLGTIINALLRQFVRDKEINLSIPLKPSKYLIKSIKEAEKEYASGKLKPYKDINELFEELGV
jgi:addiction module RelB/DinJ family antitoxin